MRILYLIVVLSMQIGFIYGLHVESLDGEVRIHPRALPLQKRSGRDCGKFTMSCANAAGACQNACYMINCVNKDAATMTLVFHLRMANVLS